MDEISAEQVIDKFLELERSSRIRFLKPRHLRPCQTAIQTARRQNDYDTHNINTANASAKAADFLKTVPPCPSRRFAGRGIVICAGGVDYFTQAWVCINMLRRHRCPLPIQLWHLGRTELDRRMETLVSRFGVECVNARLLMNRFPMRNPLGWELKCYSILHSPFEEVLSLDADNVPVANPEYLFHTPEFRRAGAIFWPDRGRLPRRAPIWNLCGVCYRDEPEFESGQILLSKTRCWKALNLAWWYNDHSEFFYRHIYGDKDTFHLAWRRTETDYAMIPFPVRILDGVMCQHDFEGQLIFQHRNSHKWKFFGPDRPVPGFLFEQDCLRYLEQLRNLWDGKIRGKSPQLSASSNW